MYVSKGYDSVVVVATRKFPFIINLTYGPSEVHLSRILFIFDLLIILCIYLIRVEQEFPWFPPSVRPRTLSNRMELAVVCVN